MVDVEVEFNYEAEQSDELSIKAGDIIRNVVMSEGGWWEGELNGKKGMFPDNFVKVIKNQEKDTKKDEGKKKDVQATKRQSVKDLANKLKGQVLEGPPMIRKKETSAKKKRAKVVYSYEPENPDELKLEVGDAVEVIKQEEEGWWEGIVNGKQGMFPSNFVEIVEDSDSTDSADNKIENTEEHMIKGKKVQGIGLGNIFGDGPIKLRSTGGAKKPGDRPSDPPKAEKREEPVRKARESKPEEKAVVRYSYAAENDDELTLNEGEIITILEKELEDSGWWRGELNGKVGVFPDNFVEIIKEELNKGLQPMNASAPQPKPKKPPPPAQPPATTKPLPKIPEKAPVIEQSKPEPVKEEKPAVQPVIPTKKPIHPPPPLTKKPKSIDVVTKEEKKEESKPESSLSFDSVETSSEKLQHPTASRPRGPSKRPPSQPKTAVSPNQDEEKNGEVKEVTKEDKPSYPLIKEEKPSYPSIKEDKTHHAHHTHHTAKHEKVEEVGGKINERSVPSRPQEPVRQDSSAATASLQLAIDDLRKEFLNLKNSTVSKSAFDELKSENEQLKQEIDSVKNMYSKRMREIMAEIDEEKKIRFATQVEIERIRKLVAESHV